MPHSALSPRCFAMLAAMGNKLKTVPIVAVVLLALTGCAADPAPDPSRSPSASAAAESTGTTLEELQAAYVDAGGQCARITARDTSVAEDAGDCDGGALLTIYVSEGQRDGAIRVLEGLQDTNPSPHVIAVGPDWIVNGPDAEDVAAAMGGDARQIGTPTAPAATQFDLATDAGICAADSEMTNLELNDALAPLLGFPADPDSRSIEQDEAIRAHKNAAFERACPARAG